jgi:hypothetical protein
VDYRESGQGQSGDRPRGRGRALIRLPSGDTIEHWFPPLSAVPAGLCASADSGSSFGFNY